MGLSKSMENSDQQASSENLCQGCSLCCRYVSIEIPKPDNAEDLDVAIWYLYHGHKIFVDADGWYLQVDRDCQNLDDAGACRIYETRPQVCRDYDISDCEKHSPTAYWKIFNTAEDLREFMKDNPACEIKNPNEK